MGRHETPAARAARRARNAKIRGERPGNERPVSLRRAAEHERAERKAAALAAAWDLVLKAAAAFAPGPPEFQYAGLAFADPADAKAYNAELRAAIASLCMTDPGPLDKWRAWASVATPWIERRKMRPVPVVSGQLPRARLYADGSVRLVAPTDADMIALLKRQAGIEDPPAPPAGGTDHGPRE